MLPEDGREAADLKLVAVVQNDQAPAVAKPRQSLQRCIEYIGGHPSPDGRLPGNLVQVAGEMTQAAMGDANTLGDTGRAGRIDDVGQAIARQSIDDRITALKRRYSMLVIHRQLGAHVECVPPRNLRACQQSARLAVLKDVVDPGGWVRRVDGQVRAARLPGGKDGDHHVEGTIDAETDDGIRPDTLLDEPVGDFVGTLVELLVGQRSTFENERTRMGLVLSVLFELPMQADIFRPGFAGLAHERPLRFHIRH
ncbi:hypothetical protein D3C71_810830 [compost metagenome]